MFPTPGGLRRQRDDLVLFHNAYGSYFKAVHDGDEAEAHKLRGELLDLIPKAERALTTADVELVVYPPPAFGGPIHRGLANVAFLHERPAYGAVPKKVMEMTRLATASLQQEAHDLGRKWKNPLYWIDQFLRAVLGLPAYLLSLIFGVPVTRIEESRFGVALRIGTAVIEGFGVYFGGRTASWW